MESLIPYILDCLEAGEPVAVAAIIGHKGSTPRTSGSKMVVHRDRRIAGTIGGGLIEARVMDACVELIQTGQSRIHEFALDKQIKDGLDMVCGGHLTVFMEALNPDRDLAAVYRAAAHREQKGQKAVLVSAIRGKSLSGFTTHNSLVLPDGSVNGTAVIPKSLLDAIRDNPFSSPLPQLYSQGLDQFVIQPLIPADTLFIFGAGHVGLSLARMAHLTDFQTVVVDDRQEFANPERFPHARNVVVTDDFDTCFDHLDIDPNAYIAILTRGHLHDQSVLEQALKRDAAYIGMIGSRSKRDQIYMNLQEKGVTEERLKAVYSPIGLPIKAETPGEIAVSIMAQIIDIRAARIRAKK